MLKQRLLTAALLIPLAVAAVLLLPDGAFAALVGIFVLMAGTEWANLMPASRPVLSTFLIALLMAALWWGRCNGAVQLGVLSFAGLWWLACSVWVTFYPAGPLFLRRPSSAVRGAAGLAVLLPTFLALVVLHGQSAAGPGWALFVLILVWAADTGAYFAGRAFGRHTLVPNVSPGKTWEGVGGGLALGLVTAAAAGAGYFGLRGWTLAGFFILCAGVVLLSVAGDLTISVMKRLAGVKDSGNLFPGHGGVLDRLDSLLAAAPCFVLGFIGLGL
jgi:phosphatidate cytidylyltransferase